MVLVSGTSLFCYAPIFTARKRSLGKVIVSEACVKNSSGEVGHMVPPGKETPLARRPPGQETPGKENPPNRETPFEGDPPAKETPPSRPTPRGEIEGVRSRPTAKGEIEGDQVQAHK